MALPERLKFGIFMAPFHSISYLFDCSANARALHRGRGPGPSPCPRIAQGHCTGLLPPAILARG
jgi:hypothetical protein